MVEKQYALDIISSLTERTIKRLWVVIILLIVLLFGSNAAWIWYESQFQGVEVTQAVEQEADNGVNNFIGIGGDYYGATESNDNG